MTKKLNSMAIKWMRETSMELGATEGQDNWDFIWFEHNALQLVPKLKALLEKAYKLGQKDGGK